MVGIPCSSRPCSGAKIIKISVFFAAILQDCGKKKKMKMADTIFFIQYMVRGARVGLPP